MFEVKDQLSSLLYLGKVSCFQTCPMKYYWLHHLHLKPKSNKACLSFGSLFHQIALEIGLAKDNFRAAEAVLFNRFDLAETLLGDPVDTKIVEAIQEATDDDLKLMQKMLPTFEEAWKAQQVQKIITTEQSYLFPVPSSVFKHWVVKPDFIYIDQEGLWVGDLKTTQGYGAATAKFYHSAPQTKTYFYFMREYLEELTGLKLLGTKIFISTKQKCRTEVEEIRLTTTDMYQAELFVREALTAMSEAERELPYKSFQRNMTKCTSLIEGECPYIPICTQKITNEAYLQDVLTNWYIQETPDKHLELGED